MNGMGTTSAFGIHKMAAKMWYVFNVAVHAYLTALIYSSSKKSLFSFLLLLSFLFFPPILNLS